MSDKLSIPDIIQNGIGIALKNFVALIVNAILWALTIWIPYLNIGTTIGLVTLPAKMGRDEGIEMTEIFNPEYRKYMGEFFITAGLLGLGVQIALLLMIVPGIALGIAWGLAILLVIDKKLDPMQALKRSNELTYGHKMTIFLAGLIFEVGVVIAFAILSLLGSIDYIGWIFYLVMLALAIGVFPIFLGMQAYIYKTLAGNA